MKSLPVHLAIASLCLLPMGSAQQTPSDQSALASVLQEIYGNQAANAKKDPAAFRSKAAAIADRHHEDIVKGTLSSDARSRALAATLLGMATPSDSGATAIIKLAKDPDKEVRYAALLAISSATDGTNQEANRVVLEALSETGNSAITRDASFTASTLKLPEALPIFEDYLKSGDTYKTLYAVEAAERYGSAGASLLPELKRLLEQQGEASKSKDSLSRAIAAVTSNQGPQSSRPDTTAGGKDSPAEPRPAGSGKANKEDRRTDHTDSLGVPNWLITALAILGSASALVWIRSARRKS